MAFVTIDVQGSGRYKKLLLTYPWGTDWLPVSQLPELPPLSTSDLSSLAPEI